MYFCLDCNSIFNEPKTRTNAYGLIYPPEYSGCPKCGGAYAETFECDVCGHWVTGEYVKLKDGTVICEDCYEIKDIYD